MLNRLSETAQNDLANLITLLLGITIAFSMRADQFVTVQTIMIMALGLVAFIFDTVAGVVFAKILNIFSRTKINPMVGAAGISAFPHVRPDRGEDGHRREQPEPPADARRGRQRLRPDRLGCGWRYYSWVLYVTELAPLTRSQLGE